MVWPVSQFSQTCPESGLEQLVSVGLPVRSASLEAAPLIVCLDGPWLFGTVLDATRIMSMADEAPEAIVVGLSFTDPSMGEYLRQRARWFTPSPFVPPEITGVKGLIADETGRAAELQAFLADRLLSAIEADHCGGLDVSSRWFVGHSFSALFGLRALLTQSELFDRWLLASPSIWWDGRSILNTVDAHGHHHDDLAARVFVSYGQEEDVGDEGPAAPFAMGSNAEELVQTLRHRRYRGLELHHEVLPGDGHSSSIGAAVSKGLRFLHRGHL